MSFFEKTFSHCTYTFYGIEVKRYFDRSRKKGFVKNLTSGVSYGSKGKNFKGGLRPMINLDYTLLIQAAIFIVFVLLINQFMFRPVVRLLERRKEATTGAQEKALSLQEKAEREAALLEEKLAQARQEAALERDRVKKKVLEEQKQYLERARRAIEKDIPALREKALEEAKKVEDSLKKGMGPFAEKIAAKVLGRSVS